MSIVGHWIPVTESMPDDETTVLVWDASLDDCACAYHDSAVLEARGDSGWIMCGTGRVLLHITHYCENILPPSS